MYLSPDHVGDQETGLILTIYPYLGIQSIRTTMWEEIDNCLVRTFEFKDFKAAFAFMTQVAMLAEQLNHHPDWRNVYNRVEIRLNTHDAGGVVTDHDRELAKAIDQLN